MNHWMDFIITLIVRFVSGFVVGCVASFILGFKVNMEAIADGGIFTSRFVIWGVLGGMICVLTTPRRNWPWVK